MSFEEEGFTEYVYKIIVVGNLGTGKTSLINQYVEGKFTNYYRSTIGVDFAHKDIQLDKKTRIRVQLWDIGGQERTQKMTRVYYKEALGAIIVFDVTRTDTFKSVKLWKEDIDNQVRTIDDKPIPVILIANKIDLVDQENGGWNKTEEEMKQYCNENNFIKCYKTSAKTAFNVQESIEYLSQYILKNGIRHEKILGTRITDEDFEETRKKKSNNNCC
ncbi:ras-related protein rab-32 [Anaeramoeba flamelloides]|uniref:Ras-related protein rab-32 n=1 Tax=Anaeramoeba flamelloides TaxID=1746091 RepID=A0AAV7Y9M2_9EUKA|nr:ras-related protein rab-32 [Anaeramoeba flamelloides]KAJ6236802.1 ras-related protein rab-32 [Anaeramoeba flamelloides]